MSAQLLLDFSLGFALAVAMLWTAVGVAKLIRRVW